MVALGGWRFLLREAALHAWLRYVLNLSRQPRPPDLCAQGGDTFPRVLRWGGWLLSRKPYAPQTRTTPETFFYPELPCQRAGLVRRYGGGC